VFQHLHFSLFSNGINKFWNQISGVLCPRYELIRYTKLNYRHCVCPSYAAGRRPYRNTHHRLGPSRTEITNMEPVFPQILLLVLSFHLKSQRAVAILNCHSLVIFTIFAP